MSDTEGTKTPPFRLVVPILCTGRSGSSMLAYMLRELGVFMGGPFTDADATNPRGTGEDFVIFHALQLHRTIASHVVSIRLRAMMRQTPGAIGWKSPDTIDHWSLLRRWDDRFLDPGGQRLRFAPIVIERPIEDVIASYEKAYPPERRRMDDDSYKEAFRNRVALLDAAVADGALRVHYYNVLQHPGEQARRILNYLVEHGHTPPCTTNHFTRVAMVVDPSLRTV